MLGNIWYMIATPKLEKLRVAEGFKKLSAISLQNALSF